MALKNPKKNSIDSEVRDYRDEDGLSTRQLDWGLRFIRYRKTAVVFLIWFLAGAGIGTLGYSLYSFAHYLIVGRAQDKQVYEDLTTQPLTSSGRSTDVPLSYPQPLVLANAGSRGDIVVPVTNPSLRSVARFDYHFVVNGVDTVSRRDFILPGEMKYLSALGREMPAGTSDVSLVIENYSLQRIDAHTIPDWNAYRSQRLNFAIADTVFVPGTSSGLTEKVNVNEMSFSITNNSPYGYRSLRLILILKSGGQVVAANDYTLENFRSGEKRSPRLGWSGNLPRVDSIEVVPDLDLLDTSAYLKYSLR